MNVLKWIAIVFASLFSVVLILNAPVAKNTYQPPSDGQSSFTPPDSEGRSVYIPPAAKTDWSRTAAECWKEYERRSLSPLEKRQIASFCEGLDEQARNTK